MENRDGIANFEVGKGQRSIGIAESVIDLVISPLKRVSRFLPSLYELSKSHEIGFS
jgi:hypothetical protein